MVVDRNYSNILLRSLIESMKKKVPGFTFSETRRWVGFYQKGGKRFAFILKSKTRPKIDVWCWGNVDEQRRKYGDVFQFRNRRETTGGFGEQFQVNFVLDDLTNVEQTTNLLAEISNSWSEEELFAAFNLYCKIPVDEILVSNTSLKSFAESLNKPIKEVVSRFMNFSKFDIVRKSLQAEDLEEKSRLVRNEFEKDWERAALRSEILLTKFERLSKKGHKGFPTGRERNSLVRTRINQDFFRQSVLASYRNSCCISGLKNIELLNASHIVPWAVDEKNRLNPHNGLCLNTLHDRAFDRGLMTVTPEFRVKVSKAISQNADSKTIQEFFLRFQNSKIALPQRFLPERVFLDYHNKNVYVG